jgi:MYXO-CTERM domain-containing protein
MNRRLLWTAVLAMLAWSATAAAQQYDYLGYKMLNTRDYPFKYYLDARANQPAGIALTEVEKATTAAFQTWENVACAYPDFQYMGYSTTNSSIADVRDTNDAFNVSTIWVTSTTDPYYNTALAGGRSTSGTMPLTYAGYLYQCDIFINAVNYRWTTLATTDPRENFRDLQTALTHEVGHCMGLADVFTPTSSVMNPEFPVGSGRRALDPQDVQQVCEYYPEDGAVGSPCSPSDPCTNGLTCIPFNDQGGTLLYRYCSKGCPGLNPGECPSPFSCQNSTAVTGSTKACLAVPNQSVTQVGKECNTSPDCGSATGICQTPAGLPSGGTAWVNGYCQQPCNAGSTANACPGGSVCVNTDPGTNDRCFKTCRPGSGDCRAGYTCAPLAEGDVCVPSCYADADCNNPTTATDFACRVCDRVCIQNRQTGRSVGDPCTTSEQCGPEQVCFFINNHPQGICTQSCNTAACGCPTGTTCKQVGVDRVCMKDCATGTCSNPLQCNPVGQTYSCTAACRTRADCPSGFECFAGGCQDPTQTPDAGCTLCGTDAGQPPPPPPPTDGGTGGGGNPSGCGCGTAPASALAFFGALALLLLAGGRRSWRRR